MMPERNERRLDRRRRDPLFAPKGSSGSIWRAAIAGVARFGRVPDVSAPRPVHDRCMRSHRLLPAVAATILTLLLLAGTTPPAHAAPPPGRGKTPHLTSLTTSAQRQGVVTQDVCLPFPTYYGWDCWWWQATVPTGDDLGWIITATLSSWSGGDVSGQQMRITAGAVGVLSTDLCTGTTDSGGSFSCWVPLDERMRHSPHGTYCAVFDGTESLAPSSRCGSMSLWS